MKFLDIYGDLKNKTVNKAMLIAYKKLTSLEGCPKKVLKNFTCEKNNLTSLEYSPKEIGGDFICSWNKLTSLEGSPEIIKGSFDVSFNNFSSLKGCCKNIGKTFYCVNIPELKNVKQQIMENQIKADRYLTDEGNYNFKDIKEEFEKYGDYLKKIELKSKIKEQNVLKKELIKKNINKITNKNDYGLSI